MVRAALDLAVANHDFQRGEFARSRQLFEAGSIPQSAFEAAKLALAQAQSQRDMAQKQYDDATLEAPFGGTITMRNAEVGDVLGPGVPAFRLIDMSRVKVQAGIPERFIGDFRKGSTVTIAFDAIADREFAGQINYIAPEASSAVRTFLAEIVIDNSAGAIRAGIMGNARIQRRTFAGALLIPLDALLETQVGRKVFVVAEDSLAVERAITIDGSGEDMVVVTAGVQAGERVVTKGQHDLVNGDRVRVTGEYREAAHGEGSAI
jgi:RND family efflux transporter MFP subunit